MTVSDVFETSSNRRSSTLPSAETSTPNMRLTRWAEMKSLSIDTDQILDGDIRRERTRQVKVDVEKKDDKQSTRVNVIRDNSRGPVRGCFSSVLDCFR